MNKKDELKAIEDFISLGYDISGGVSGAALGFFAGGIEGALLGGATAPVFTRLFRELGNEVKDRLLGQREKVRIGAVMTFAISKVQENLNQGKTPRNDNFFNNTEQNSRTTADEIAEGILQAAQREYEERKIQYLGKLLGNIAFSPEINRSEANFLIRTAQSLTYRQLCILAMTPRVKSYPVRTNDYRGGSSIPPNTIPILYEITSLYKSSLINFGGEVLFGPTDVHPSKMTIQGLGAKLYNLMELRLIPQKDQDEIVLQLGPT